jgi:hypothetical protein
VRQVVEVLGKARDQVALRDHQVHGELNAQFAIQFEQPLAGSLDVLLAFRVALHDEVVSTDGQNDAVDGATLAVLPQKREEL